MACKDIEGLIPAYVLDALGDEEVLQVESHLAGCTWCSGLVRTQLEVAANLSLAVEQVTPPRRVWARTKQRIAANPPNPVAARETAVERFRRRPVSIIGTFVYAGALIALLLLGGVLAFTLRTSGQMEDLKETNRALTGQVGELQQDNDALSSELAQLMDHNSEMGEQVSKLNEDSSVVTAEVVGLISGSKALSQQMNDLAISGQELLSVLRTQRSIVYMLTLPNTRVLSMETRSDASAQGNLMLNFDNQWSVFVATGLNPLPLTQQYNVWLRRGNEEFYAGVITIDDMGWGIALLAPDLTMAEYQWVGVTVESISGSGQPSRRGELVLWGELSLAGPLYPASPSAPAK